MQEENGSSAGKKNDYMMPLSILAAGILVGGAVIYSVNVKSPNPNEGAASPEVANSGASAPKVESYDVVLGKPDAPVTLIEFGDYQCPFCNKFFTDAEPLIRENYVKTGLVKEVWRDFAFLGQESLVAAQAAQCAKDQGKFWEYHDAIMTEEKIDGRENNGNLTESKFESFARTLGMDVQKFSACATSDKYRDIVKSAYDSGLKAGVNSTPTVFINGVKSQGALPYSAFKALIDAALPKK